jgi:hypothetical protein
MRRHRPFATGSIIAALALLALGGPLHSSTAGAQTVREQKIAVEPVVSKLASYGGVVVWSHWQTGIGSFRLDAHYRGRTVALRVSSRGVPFDVDLGPDQHGHVVAVYSRCRIESPVWVPLIPSVAYPLPRGCVLYRYDFATGRERRIAGIAGSGSFYLPTIWRNEIAYVRSRSSRSAVLYVQPLSAPRGHRLVAIPLRGGSGAAPGPVGLDLRGNGLAVAWDEIKGGQTDSEIRLDTFSSKRELTSDALDSQSSQRVLPGFLGFPALTADGLFYGRFDGPASPPDFDSFDVINAAGAGRQHGAPHALRGQTRDGSTTYGMYGPYSGTFSNCGLSGCTLSAFVGLP